MLKRIFGGGRGMGCAKAQAPIEALEPRRMLAHVPTGFSDSVLATGLFSPTAMVIAPDGRIFVAEQTGDVRVIKNGALLTQPFLHLDVTSFGEHGLLGIELDPNFETNHFVYVFYTTAGSTFHNRVSRFTADGDVAEPGSEDVLLNADNLDPTQLFHDGGALHFGPDGDLYISTGENEHPDNSQSLTNLEGKILRMEPDGTIPPDNPFYDGPDDKNGLIWAYGFRNPFTFGFQPGTGLMYIDDVGQDTWEEINQGQAGGNYGWPQQEGEIGKDSPGIVLPVFDYNHTIGQAITGGVFYPTGTNFPSKYQGKYYFSDIGGNWIHILNPNTHAESNFATGVGAPIDLDVGSDGSLYVLGRSSPGDTQDFTGFVSVISYTANQPARIVSQPMSQTVAVGAAATFGVSASGQGLSYQWQRNDKNIGGATGSSYTISATALSDNGAKYRVVVKNSFGTVTSASATLGVLNDKAPVVKSVLPGTGTTFYAGETFNYSATAIDPEDGDLHGSQFTWEVDYHTGAVVRPFVPPTSGARGGTFTIPTITPYTLSNVYYQIILTVKDSKGVTTTATRNLLPRTVNVTVKTDVAGLDVQLEGEDSAATTFSGVVGVARQIGAAATQTLHGKTYDFDSWSDGGDTTHEISTPTTNSTYVAHYVLAPTQTPTVTTLNPTDDATVQGGMAANTNFGSNSLLIVKDYSTASYNREAYLNFDINSLDTITDAKVRVYGLLSGVQNANVPLGIFGAITDGFNEQAITYDERPGVGAMISKAIVSTYTTEQWYEFDVTSYLKQLKAEGKTSATFVLKNLVQTSVYDYFKSNNNYDTDHIPQLVVTG